MKKEESETRLLLDSMLGRLAKWLRLMGYDAAYETDADDLHLARRARSENRVLLTRDHELAQRRGLHTLLITSQDLEEQIEQVKETFGPPPDAALSRCSLCNVPLETVSPVEIADRVPPYVLRTHDTFRRCPDCAKIYWAGSHIEHMREQVKDFDPD
jgi:uncharacterized protein with PIN domain